MYIRDSHITYKRSSITFNMLFIVSRLSRAALKKTLWNNDQRSLHSRPSRQINPISSLGIEFHAHHKRCKGYNFLFLIRVANFFMIPTTPFLSIIWLWKTLSFYWHQIEFVRHLYLTSHHQYLLHIFTRWTNIDCDMT